MKKFLMAIVLCLVCTLCFGEESVYIRTTDCCINDILLNQWDFVIAHKNPNNSDIYIFNSEFGERYSSMQKCNSITIESINDSFIVCSDSLSLKIVNDCIYRNKDGKYLNFIDNNLIGFLDSPYELQYSFINSLLLIYNQSRYIGYRSDLLSFVYMTSAGTNLSNDIGCHTLEIYKKVPNVPVTNFPNTPIINTHTDIKKAQSNKTLDPIYGIVFIVDNHIYNILGQLIQ